MKGLYSIVFLCFISASRILLAQTVNLEELQEIYLREKYVSATAPEKLFMNGSVYRDAYPRADGHQFYHEGMWSRGWLVMAGRFYDGLFLKYDLSRDELLYSHLDSSGTRTVMLNKQRIDSFNIDGHLFCLLTKSASFQGLQEEGFYEAVGRGPTRCYVRWRKRYDPPSVNSVGRFTLDPQCYILKDRVIYRITGKSSLCKALKDKEKLVRKFIRDNLLVIRGDDPIPISRTIDYINGLFP